MGEVASLYASLRLATNPASWKQADNFIKRVGDGLKKNDASAKRAQSSFNTLGSGLKRLAVAAGAMFVGGKAKNALIDFNSTVEDTRLQIAGMMALATKTDLNDNLSQADRTLANLSARAAKLPGTTAEYATMLGLITQPILDAKLGMQDLEDITVSAVVASKALGIQGEVAARDIDQAIRGQFRSTDVLTGKLLGSLGYKGEAGRQKFNAMSAQKRAAELKRALTQKQIAQLGAAQGETFSGVMSTLQDSIQRFFGKVGLPLFKAITAQLKQWVAWFEKNSAKVEAFAQVLSAGLMKAFQVLGNVVEAVVEMLQEIYEDEDIRAAFEVITTVVGALAKALAFVIKKLHALGILKYVLLPFIGLFKALGYVINNVGGWVQWLGNQFISMGGTVKNVFGAIVDWIAAKVQWVVDKVDYVIGKAKSIGGAAFGAVNFPVNGSPPAMVSGAASTASRVVPSSPAGAPPNVNLQAPVTVKIAGNMPPEWIDIKVDQRIKTNNERTWRDVNAAVSGEEQ